MLSSHHAEEFCPGLHRAARTVVVIDLVESVRLMHTDELCAIRRWRKFVHEVQASVLPLTGGRLVKSLGDGLLLEFESVPPALAAAFDMQRLIGSHNSGVPADAAMLLRVGIHAAEIVIDELDVYGAGVNLAARLASLAGPGEIVVSAEVCDLLTAGIDADVEDLGFCHLRNLEQPVRAFRVGPASVSPMPLSTTRPAQLAPAIAIIPPRPLGKAAVDGFVGEIIADGVIARLCGSRLVRVISRLSCSAVSGRPMSTAELGALLGATYVASGTYSIRGQQMTLVMELSEASSQEVLWTQHLQGDVRDLTASHSALIDAVAEAIQRSVIESSLSHAMGQTLPTLCSYALFLSALTLMHRATRAEFERSREFLEHLVDRHRRHPAPRAWLAQWYVLKLTRGWSRGEDGDASRALDHTRRAIDLDPTCALAYGMAGFVHCHLLQDLATAADLYQRALDVNPNDSLTWLFRGVLHTFLGKGAEAWHDSQMALSLSPLDPISYYYQSLAASAAVGAGHYEEAIGLALRSLRANRTHTSTYRALAMAQSLSGRTEEARATGSQLLKLEPTFTVQEFLRRSPSGRTPAGAMYAEALRIAGIPEQRAMQTHSEPC